MVNCITLPSLVCFRAVDRSGWETLPNGVLKETSTQFSPRYVRSLSLIFTTHSRRLWASSLMPAVWSCGDGAGLSGAGWWKECESEKQKPRTPELPASCKLSSENCHAVCSLHKGRLDFGGPASLFTDCYSYMGVHMLPPMSPAHQARQVSGLRGKSV